MTIFLSTILSFCYVFIGPFMAVFYLIQNCSRNVCSSQDGTEKKGFYKIFACAMLFYIFALTPQGYIDACNYLVAIPNMIVEKKCLGIVILVFLIIMLYPYLNIRYEESGVNVFYKYRDIRKIVIGIQVLSSFGVILYLSMVNAQIIKEYTLWKYLLFFDFAIFVCIILVSAIRVAFETTGAFFEYNTIVSQKKIYKYGENEIKVTEDNGTYIVSNGIEEVQLNKITQYQKEGVMSFCNLIKGT